MVPGKPGRPIAAFADDELEVDEDRPAPWHPRRRSRPTITILFVAANAPSGRLALDAEYRAIEQRLRAARYRRAFQLIPKFAAHAADLQEALLEHQPDVVHFACHGSAAAELILVGDQSEPAPVPAAALASLFRVLHDNLALVVFNACFAGEQAEAIRQSARLSVGMRTQIEDRAAIAFASALYGALAYGRSVRDSFDLGIAAVQATGAKPDGAPEIYAATGVDPRRVVLVGPRPRGRARPMVALVGLCAVLAWYALSPSKEEVPAFSSSEEEPPGMVRFRGGDLQLGWFDASWRLALCAPLRSDEDCAVRREPGDIPAARVASFYLDRNEVTNGELADWFDSHPAFWRATGDVLARRTDGTHALVRLAAACGGGLRLTVEGRVLAGPDQGRRPAVCVTWYGAREYCRARGKRLPTAAEWELAAKGAEGRPFPWGGGWPMPDGVSFDRRDSTGRPQPRDVGLSPQDVSPEGVHDLGGNVAEWVEDDQSPAGIETIRGGSWASQDPCHLLGSGCKRIDPKTNAADVGFRCARSAEGLTTRIRRSR